MQHDALVRVEHEARARRKRVSRDRHAERSVHVAGGVRIGRTDVQHRDFVALSHLPFLERGGRADERAAVQLHDARSRRWPGCRDECGDADELVEVGMRQRRVRPLLLADRRGSLRAHRRAAQRARHASQNA